IDSNNGQFDNCSITVRDKKKIIEDIHEIDSNNGQLIKVNNKGGVQ
ncbi:hypothetical protein Q604_UNBC16108G0002, partial [human gut metagenome]